MATDTLGTLIPDVANLIFPYVDKETFLSLRCVNKHLNSLASGPVFRQLKLLSNKDSNSHTSFVNIAKTEHLRTLVREVILDFSDQVPGNRTCPHNNVPPPEFLNALPFLRAFRNLVSLQMRLPPLISEAYTSYYDNEPDDVPISISHIRYRVLETVFQCLAGEWNLAHQIAIDDGLRERQELCFETDYMGNIEIPKSDGKPIQLQRLSIKNLHAEVDARLEALEARRTVLSSTSLMELDLSVSVESYQGAYFFSAYHKTDDFFGTFQKDWLLPSIAQNLRVLQLNCDLPWGWMPKANLPAIKPVFPNLKKLSLGHYTFTHESQVDWIASMGRDSPSGGLEELELYSCVIVYHVHHRSRLMPTAHTDPRWNQEHDFIMVIDFALMRSIPGQPDRTGLFYSNFSLRWHTVLDYWRRNIPSLKSFHFLADQGNAASDESGIEAKWKGLYQWCSQRHHPDWKDVGTHPQKATDHCPPNAAQLGSKCCEDDETSLLLLMDAVKARREGKQPDQDMSSGYKLPDGVGARLYRLNGDGWDDAFEKM